MAGYTKLFSSILTSTIWSESKDTRILWITMLAMADKYGRVEASIPGLAQLARLSIAEIESAIHVLENPDEYSRTTENQGRRIKSIEGGWLILNHDKYRNKLNADQIREYNAEAKRRSRQRKKLRTTPTNNNQSKNVKDV